MSARPRLAALDLASNGGEPRASSDLGTKSGLLPRQRIRAMVQRKMIQATAGIEEGQFQPASLDLRLGARAFRVRASFLPGREKTVHEQLSALKFDEINLERGAVLERGCVYLVELQEHLRLPDSISALANPKSSSGRLDVFTRLIANHSEAFDSVEAGYEGPLFAEISPRSFSIKVRKGSKLNQIRFRRRNSQQDAHTNFQLTDKELREQHASTPLVDGEATIRNGLVLRVDLSYAGEAGTIIGYKAQAYADIVDVDRVGAHDVAEYWEPIFLRPDRRLILDPHRFYILASAERLHVPADLAAEMVPIDPMMGEFRVHYAGFFDPGFGMTAEGKPGSRAVLEVRSHEVPFLLEDGQIVGRLAYERLSEAPDALYGEVGGANYQGQGLKLSKHFR